VVKANLNLNSKPKILMVMYFWPNKFIGCSMILKLTNNAFKVQLLGSSNKVQVYAKATTGPTYGKSKIPLMYVRP